MRITPKDLLECELMHDHGGGPWLMVEDLDADYCRVGQGGGIVKGELVGGRAYLAWKEKLSVYMKEDTTKKGKPMIKSQIAGEALEHLKIVREALKGGRAVVESTHIRPILGTTLSQR